MELRPGYKQTEVGVIPEEWEVDCVGNICSISVGRDLKEQNYSPVADQKYRFPIYSNTVENFGLYGYYDFAEYQGESLTVVGRGIGLGTAFARSGGFGAIGRLLVLFPNSKAAPIFLAEYINFFVTIFDESSGIPQLTGLSFAKYKLPLPPLPEQRAIATALSDVDALIASLDKLIAKKRDMKQAAMQELLTGKRRLPGFSGEWEVRRLGEVCEISMGRTPSRRNPAYWGKGYKWLSIADLQQKVISESKEEITELAASEMPIIPKGTLLMSFKLSIGRLCFAGCDLFTNEAICSFNKLQANADYLYYALGRVDFSLYGKQAVKGYTLNKESLKLVEVSYPPLPEQTAIAAILSDMDTEIAALEQKRDKTRLLKQGMMQELLTGRIRLV